MHYKHVLLAVNYTTARWLLGPVWRVKCIARDRPPADITVFLLLQRCWFSYTCRRGTEPKTCTTQASKVGSVWIIIIILSLTRWIYNNNNNEIVSPSPALVFQSHLSWLFLLSLFIAVFNTPPPPRHDGIFDLGMPDRHDLPAGFESSEMYLVIHADWKFQGDV